MSPSYNGWEDTPEDEREALDRWEGEHLAGRRSSRGIPRHDYQATDGTGSPDR
jgi:hypothetical protein